MREVSQKPKVGGDFHENGSSNTLFDRSTSGLVKEKVPCVGLLQRVNETEIYSDTLIKNSTLEVTQLHGRSPTSWSRVHTKIYLVRKGKVPLVPSTRDFYLSWTMGLVFLPVDGL